MADNSIPMAEPLAYFLTWTTYGTWLPGDDRGWVLQGQGIQPPNPQREARARSRMAEEPCVLDAEQRRLVEETIARHCTIRGWNLHAVNCRSNHVHVVVTADRDPATVMDQFKAWTARRLKEHAAKKAPAGRVRQKWWTEGGSRRYLNDEASLEAANVYVLEGQ